MYRGQPASLCQGCTIHWKEHQYLWSGRDQCEVQGNVLPRKAAGLGGGRAVIYLHKDLSFSLRCGFGAPPCELPLFRMIRCRDWLGTLWRQAADVTQMWVHTSLELPVTLLPSSEVDPRIQETSGSEVQAGPSPGAGPPWHCP